MTITYYIRTNNRQDEWRKFHFRKSQVRWVEENSQYYIIYIKKVKDKLESICVPKNRANQEDEEKMQGLIKYLNKKG